MSCLDSNISTQKINAGLHIDTFSYLLPVLLLIIPQGAKQPLNGKAQGGAKKTQSFFGKLKVFLENSGNFWKNSRFRQLELVMVAEKACLTIKTFSKGLGHCIWLKDAERCENKK